MSAKLGAVDKTAEEARCDTHLTATEPTDMEQHASGLRRAFAALRCRVGAALAVVLGAALLSAIPAAAADEPTRTDEWTGTGDLPADALDVCTAEAADAVARGGGWQYRLGRSVLQAGVLRSAHFHRYDRCAVVIATTRQHHDDGWLPLSRLVWVSTDPLDRARDGWRLVYGTTPGVRDPIRPSGPASPQLITVTDCAGWNRNPLPLDASNRYDGPGTLYLDKADIDGAHVVFFVNARPTSNSYSWTGRTYAGELLVGNVRYGGGLLSGAFLQNRPTPTVDGDFYAYPRGSPGWRYTEWHPTASC